MAGCSVKKCPACGKTSKFRNDYKTCCTKGGGTKPQEAPVLTDKNEIAENNWTISLPKTSIHTLQQLIEYFQVDLSVWEVERFVANKWEVVMKPPAYTELFTVVKPNSTKTKEATVQNEIPLWQRDKDKTEPLHESLYQVKAFLKRKVNIVTAKNEIEELKKLAK